MRKAIWLFPVVFLIHDSEELLTVEAWSERHHGMLVEHLGSFLSERTIHALSWTTPRFAAAMAVLFALICWLSRNAARRERTMKDIKLFFLAVTVLFVNVFTHAAQALWFGGYTPGVVTALTVALPYTVYVYVVMFRKGGILKGHRADSSL